MAKTVDPGALENLHSENAFKGSVTKKDEGAAHPIQARSSLLQSRPNTFAQTNSVILTFRLQNGGGPYIPVGRCPAQNSLLAIYRESRIIGVRSPFAVLYSED